MEIMFVDVSLNVVCFNFEILGATFRTIFKKPLMKEKRNKGTKEQRQKKQRNKGSKEQSNNRTKEQRKKGKKEQRGPQTLLAPGGADKL